ncbi:hypothetical protein NEAUS04_0188 [Nematocida ausubeli]|uniref:Uncharacterized protein n=1 Tax=Nematocida ausubeli (strain ATCC PRA-371 / ERTm2) TaxID=1913371 RepID=A0A086IYZ3_NEMA1|nr:uncharacterized protein NESG_02433 [Nematocida ausubeli]KAI5132287.1 hypothetical protein NEAUS06_0076 [Nematocida ausubeli]KAI5133568.1 hypothetical protein NEAUS07_0462 [Nematocida ausubeli]KAI5147180.1 hypothetical protein NEAUS05_0502 [Nematocida ausubeli]KAI5160855.1 hypothetical protein NEAUS04_0188 [Nematocida ausubeli]KFG25111.1 hypothetical protein NESG_02433 [Nematocida ausubeli]
MELLPIRARANEGTPNSSELFFIDSKKYSPEYFITCVFPFIPGVEKDETPNLKPRTGSPAIRVYEDLHKQIKKYTADIDRFKELADTPTINLSIDFKVLNYLHIQDKVCFRFPIKNEPEIYAADLFRAHSIPEGEVLAIFIFYIRESILVQIREILSLRDPEGIPVEKEEFQQKQATVHTEGISTLNQQHVRYDSFGKIVISKETPDKKRKKKQGDS